MFITIALVWLLVAILAHQDLRIEVEMCVLRNLRAVEVVSLHTEVVATLREDIAAEVLHIVAAIVAAPRTAVQPRAVALVAVRPTVAARPTVVALVVAHRIVVAEEAHEADSFNVC